MALQMTVKTPHGFSAVDAYHRVEGIVLTGKDSIAFRVRSYKSEEIDVAFSDQFFSCSYNIDGENPIKQAYEHIKKFSEFADAEDV